MKIACNVGSFVAICLLVFTCNAQAMTIDSLNRSITLFQTTTESNAPGAFNEGLSWANGYLDDNYDSNRGNQNHGAQVYQNSSIEYDSAILTAGGVGGLDVWLPSTDNISVYINSRFDLLFTPLTGALYTFLNGSDGGNVTFEDLTTPDFIYDENGYLIAGHQYRLMADDVINVKTTNGLNSGSYWGFSLTVKEIPSNTTVPEPGTMLLLGSGLAGIVVFAKKRSKA